MLDSRTEHSRRQKIHVEPLSHVLEQVRRLLPVGQLLIGVESRSARRVVVDLLAAVVPFVVIADWERTGRSRHH